MLAIEVEYLMGRVYAADFRESAIPEWPPHPSRLFSALVAAHHDESGSDGERCALEWLSEQGAPQIAAGKCGVSDEVTTFVPTNYAGKGGGTHPLQRGKQPRFFPAQSPDNPLVQFIWPEASPTAIFLDSLDQLAGRVASLGRSCSLVRMRVVSEADIPTYVPSNSGRHVLRVFGTGRLEELETLYKLDQRPNCAPQARYAAVEEFTKLNSQRGCFGEMVIFRRMSGIGLPCEATLTLTDATRRAILKVASEAGLLCDMLTGHGDHPHCAFAALPFAGHAHASGKLMGVALILPRHIDSKSRNKVLRTCALLETINLREALGAWNVEIANFDVTQKTLQPETWMGPSPVWSTVTPVLLDRFPKKSLTPEDVLAQACERIGLPQPMKIECGAYSAFDGVPPSSSFRVKRTNEERARFAVHATFTFGIRVSGPLLIGAGRYFGLGLLRPGCRDTNDA